MGADGLVGVGGGSESVDGKLAEVGVVERLGGRWLRCIERLAFTVMSIDGQFYVAAALTQ